MKYICFCYYDTKKFATLSAAQLEQIGKACKPHDAAMHATGKVLAVGSLSLPKDWKHATPKNGTPMVKDGPFHETDETIGAFVIVNATDMDDAMSVASKHPAANYGEELGFAVEVRPCDTFEWGKELKP